MQTAFEQYFTGLKGKQILVMGLGVSNRPLVRLLLSYGCKVTGCDRTPREKLDEEILELEKLGFTCTDSKTNFLFAKSDKMSGDEIYSRLREILSARLSLATRLVFPPSGQFSPFWYSAEFSAFPE